ncbi:MAG TPA: hypothetical protein VN306_01110 [Mycobacterium sp.]|nr:hypothetical protein [Mycobacterium sp.]
MVGRATLGLLAHVAGTLDLLVDEKELARRAAEAPPRNSIPLRGYERLHAQHVLQADQRCDRDFLVDHDGHQRSDELQVPSRRSATPNPQNVT